ncbi:MAG: tRNA (adenosine(37)-N6)-dimethylallyltransferase MiaA [Gammaproteobacteria bacterium]|nr:tRNA (adenosine(37)-N6)-dimethylallyltransferase MiaA [Gammaproteobacteria bacterium]
MTEHSPPLLFVMGPTGAGKSALALALAERLPVELVSVDSAQVYRGFDIGTAKPNPAVRRRVPHHLLDICAPTAAYSAAQFRSDAQAVIASIRARGRVPMLVGGTGLYFRALEQGLSDLPAADPVVRARLQEELGRLGAAALHARLAGIDPRAAERIHPNDPQRLLRALEVHAVSGISQSEMWERARLAPHAGQIIKLVIAPADRALLHARLALRFNLMLERGLVNEVRALRDGAALDADAPAMRTVGYREVWRYVVGEYARTDMIERGIIATRQLAKRQLTWLRRERDCTWMDSSDSRLLERALALLRAQNVFKHVVSDLE